MSVQLFRLLTDDPTPFVPTNVMLAQLPDSSVVAYPYTDAGGMNEGAAYATLVAVGAVYGYLAKFSSGGTKVVTFEYSPEDEEFTWYLRCYEWNISTGFGDFVNEVDVGPDYVLDEFVFSPLIEEPYVLAVFNGLLKTFAWSEETGFGDSYSSPVGVDEFTGKGKVIPSPAGNAVLWCSGSPLAIIAYHFTIDLGYFNIYDEPPDVPEEFFNSTMAFIDSGHIAYMNSNRDVLVYPWSDVTGFGLALGPYEVPYTGGSFSGIFAVGNLLYTKHSDPTVYIYPFDPETGFGTPYAQPADPLVTYGGHDFMFSEDYGSIISRTDFLYACYLWDVEEGFGDLTNSEAHGSGLYLRGLHEPVGLG